MEILKDNKYKNQFSLNNTYQIVDTVQVVNTNEYINAQKSDILITDNSILNMILINDYKDKDLICNMDIQVSRNAELNIDIINVNSANYKLNLKVDLKDEYAKANINIIDLSLLGNQMNYEINVNNKCKSTKANINFKAISANDSSVIANINSHIYKEAENSENFQKSKAILLNNSARVDINPMLLIDNGKVKASHSADISPVPYEEMYYLMSRAIPSSEAEKLIIKAFINSQIDLICIEEYKDKIMEMIFSELE